MLQKPQDISLQVECYAGYQGDETPRRFSFGGRQVEVIDVIDRWRTPDCRYFRIMGDDGGTYLLRYLNASGRWEIATFAG